MAKRGPYRGYRSSKRYEEEAPDEAKPEPEPVKKKKAASKGMSLEQAVRAVFFSSRRYRVMGHAWATAELERLTGKS